jgi:hypothetical protein
MEPERLIVAAVLVAVGLAWVVLAVLQYRAIGRKGKG